MILSKKADIKKQIAKKYKDIDNMFAEIHKEIYSTLPFALATLGLNTNQRPIDRPEGFNYHQFIWVCEGCGLFQMGGERFVLEAGEGVFIRAGFPNSYEGKHFVTSWCSFTMPEDTLDYLGIGDYLRFSVPSYLDQEADQLMRLANGDSTPLSRSSAGYAFVTELFSSILNSDDSISVKALRLLEQKYSEPLTLTDIADELRVDRFLLCRVYKKERGITIMNELNRIRIAKAKRFLKHGNAPVEEVGRMCGFESPSYFGKRFREATGQTPAEYRKARR